MRLPLLVCFAVAALAGLLALGLSVLGHADPWPSYLAAWLCLLALPLGALPLVLLLESCGGAETPILPVLRRLLWPMPLVALLAIPWLMHAHHLFPGLDAAGGSAAQLWRMRPIFIGRAACLLLVFTALALVFARPPASRPRPVLAALGLALTIVLGTVAAVDWIMSVATGFTSSALGPLVLVAQSGLALALAVALTPMAPRSPQAAPGAASPRATGVPPVARGPAGMSGPVDVSDVGDMTTRRAAALGLALLLSLWVFLAFTQYLVVWSANLPGEVLWYRQRSAGIGAASEDLAAILCVLAFVGLVPRSLGERPRLLVAIALALAVLHLGEMFWLVTPAYRGAFGPTLLDLSALCGLGALTLGLMLALGHGMPRGAEGRP